VFDADGIDYMFGHLQFWFNGDVFAMVKNDPFKSILAAERLGNEKPTGPVYFEHNRWDPFGPYQSMLATARDYCAKGGDVTVWTNAQPSLFNKLDAHRRPGRQRML
jgi:hypothetical protein